MSDLSDALSHAGDPATSRTAAISLDADGRQSLKDALLMLLDERPRTADELTSAYMSNAEANLWPLYIDTHNVKRRLSELHTIHHVIRDSADRRLSLLGRSSVVWMLAVPLDEARVIVGARL